MIPDTADADELDEAPEPDSGGQDYATLPVRIANDPTDGAAVAQQAADFGAWGAVVIASGDLTPKQLLPFDGSRAQAQVSCSPGASGSSGAGAASIQGTGNLAAGFLAGATVTSITLPPGTYSVNWNVNVGGTVTAADANNLQLVLNGTPVATAVTATGSTANFQGQLPITVTVPPGASQVLAAVAPAVGSGTASIRAQIVATPEGAAGAGVYLGSVAQVSASPPLGFWLPSGVTIPVRNNQQLWCVGTGSPVTVSVLAERWGSP